MWNESKLHWRQQHTGFSRLFNALITLKQDSMKPASMQSCFELLVYRCSHSSVISVAAGFIGSQRQLGCALVSKSSIFQVPCLCSFILFPPLWKDGTLDSEDLSPPEYCPSFITHSTWSRPALPDRIFVSLWNTSQKHGPNWPESSSSVEIFPLKTLSDW